MWCKHFSHWPSHLSSPQLLFPGLGLGKLVGFEGLKEIIPRKMPLCGCGSVVLFEKENTYGCQGFCLHFHCVSRGPGTLSCRKSKEEEPVNAMWAWEQWGSSVTIMGLRGQHVRSVWGETMRALFRRLKSIPAASLNSEVTWISWWPDGPERAHNRQSFLAFYVVPQGHRIDTCLLTSFFPHCEVLRFLGPSWTLQTMRWPCDPETLNCCIKSRWTGLYCAAHPELLSWFCSEWTLQIVW